MKSKIEPKNGHEQQVLETGHEQQNRGKKGPKQGKTEAKKGPKHKQQNRGKIEAKQSKKLRMSTKFQKLFSGPK